MNITKTISGMASVMALTLVTAGASMAQVPFSFTAHFAPSTIFSSGGIGNVIQVTDGGNPAQLTPTAIQLANFTEFSNTPPPTQNMVNQSFTEVVAITTTAGTVTHTFSGTISGMFNTNQTFTNVVVNAPGSQNYVFPGLGTLVVGNLNFDQPGTQGSPTLGSLSATVTGAPSSTPEPATVVPFALGGLGLLGLIVRKTRHAGSVA